MLERIAAASARLASNIKAPQYFFCPAPARWQPSERAGLSAGKSST
jgi:hypothetical protein